MGSPPIPNPILGNDDGGIPEEVEFVLPAPADPFVVLVLELLIPLLVLVLILLGTDRGTTPTVLGGIFRVWIPELDGFPDEGAQLALFPV